jgi:Uma2 family endonuclease
MTTYATVSTETIYLPPGTVIRIPGSWEDYQTLRQSRKDASIPRIKYRTGEVTLMAPLPKHGRDANILADIVKALLDSQSRNYEAFTPITMELPEEGGIEPDYCFYINHWQVVVGRDRIEWGVDPSPDLVIEIDVTSYTDVNDYLPYAVPEVWLLKQGRLSLHQLEGGLYHSAATSQYFPDSDLQSIVAETFNTASTLGSGAAIQQLRQRL